METTITATRTNVYTIVGDKATVAVDKVVVDGDLLYYAIRHECFRTPENPLGEFQNVDLELVGRYARKIAQEGDAF